MVGKRQNQALKRGLFGSKPHALCLEEERGGGRGGGGGVGGGGDGGREGRREGGRREEGKEKEKEKEKIAQTQIQGFPTCELWP